MIGDWEIEGGRADKNPALHGCSAGGLAYPSPANLLSCRHAIIASIPHAVRARPRVSRHLDVVRYLVCQRAKVLTRQEQSHGSSRLTRRKQTTPPVGGVARRSLVTLSAGDAPHRAASTPANPSCPNS